MKKGILFSLLIFALTLLLVACNSDTSQKGNGETSNNKKEKTEQKTKVFKDINGDVKVPVKPERIVAINFLGDLAAVGVKPVGAGSLALENSALLKEELEGVENVGDVSVEKVLELQPDLIIVPSYIPGEVIDQLKKIGPTVVLDWGGFVGTDLLDEVRQIAELVGKEKEAEKWITGYEEKAKKAKLKIEEVIGPDETVGSYAIWAKNFWVWDKKRDGGYNLFEMMGLQTSEKIEKEIFKKGEGIDISLEVLPEYTADHMFVSVYEPDGGAERAKEVMDTPIWKGIPAVKKDQVYLIDYKDFWMNDGLNLEKQLDILVDIILSKNKDVK